jgi:hypothetical protein
MEKAKQQLLQSNAIRNGVNAVVHKGTPLYIDVMRALEQTSKVSTVLIE